jgi:hypothetical protein
MIRQASIEDDTYEPYSGGLPSPRSDWPQELTSIENPTVSIGSKNLLELTVTSRAVDTGTLTVNPDNSLTLNGTVSKNTAVAIGKFRHNGTFIFSAGVNYDSLLGSYMYLSFDNGVHVGWYGVDKTFSINESVGTAFIIVVAGTYSNVTVRPMVRLATVGDAAYESYKEMQMLPLNYTIRGLAVRYGSNYVDYIDENGNKWIHDTIDLERGVYIQKIGVANNDTCSLVDYSLLSQTGRGQLVAAPNPPKLQGVYGTLCNVAVRNDVALEAVDGEYYENPANIVLVGAEGEDEVTLRERLADFEYLYVLETPIETALTAEELEAFKVLYTNYPNTTVLNDAGARMELKYNADTEIWIDNRITERLPLKSTTITLYENKWIEDGLKYSQVVSINGTTANSKIDLQPSPDQLADFVAGGVSLTTVNDNGVITVYAIGATPEGDCSMQVLITEVVQV